MRAEDRSTERGTVSWLVRRYVASRTDITEKAQQQYAWAIPHIENGLGAIPLATLDRDDVARWIDDLAAGGKLSKRSVQICRTVLARGARRGGRRGTPRALPGGSRSDSLARWPSRSSEKDAVAWTAAEVDRFLAATADHRWAIAFRLGVLYGLRRSEVLALRWDDVDIEARTPCASTRASSRPTRAQRGATPRTSARDAPSRSTRTRCAASPSDAPSRPPNASRPVPSGRTTTSSSPPAPAASSCPAPTTGRSRRSSTTPACRASRPTASATRQRRTWCSQRATSASSEPIADLLGHSPEMLMNTYAHALPNSQTAIVERLRRQ